MRQRGQKNCIPAIIGAALIAASFLQLFLSRKVAGMGQWYATHIYPVIVGSVGKISGFFPFSVVEILLYAAILIIIFDFLWSLVSAIRRPGKGSKKKGGRLAPLAGFAGRLVLFAGILLFIYTCNCGINYHRTSFASLEDFEIREYSPEELAEVCKILTEDVNRDADRVARDEDGVMRLKMPIASESAQAVAAMSALGEEYPELDGFYPPPKPLAVSEILSYQSLTGVYSPFTVEANFNADMTAYNIPFTQCHELSHLRGFMQEEEANFIAYLACITSGSEEFRYSGSLVAWVKCMNVLYREDPVRFSEIREGLSDPVNADLRANNAFWERYKGKVSEVSEKVNDRYLKANGQSEGVKSYDRMVDLVVAYYMKK